MNILVINCGSSSLKYQLLDFEERKVLAKGLAERIGIAGSLLNHEAVGGQKVKLEIPMENHNVAVKAVLDALVSSEYGVISDMSAIAAVGHRVVHGGERFAQSALVTDDVKHAIKACYPLAPLHNPPNMIGIEACEAAMPGVPMVAVFDTAFHQTMPASSFMYALPYEYYTKHGIRRYGFHGTSHAYVSEQAAEFLGKSIEDLKIVTCHLGNGSSITAVDGGKCLDTSMGMTPLAGVCMGTRTGDMDPAVVTLLMEQVGLTTREVNDLMNKQSGVAGISGVSSDFRDLSAAAAKGNDRAQLALDMFAHQVRKYIGSYAVAMDGLDVIVFTAGIGENAYDVRESICTKLNVLGAKLDLEANKQRKGEPFRISTADSNVEILVIPTNEELRIAQRPYA